MYICGRFVYDWLKIVKQPVEPCGSIFACAWMQFTSLTEITGPKHLSFLRKTADEWFAFFFSMRHGYSGLVVALHLSHASFIIALVSSVFMPAVFSGQCYLRACRRSWVIAIALLKECLGPRADISSIRRKANFGVIKAVSMMWKVVPTSMSIFSNKGTPPT